MNTDHRRPLVAFVLVAMAGALVLVQGMPSNSVPTVSAAPSFRALFDPPAPTEGSVWFPLQDGLEVGKADTVPPEALSPSLGVVEEAVGGEFSFSGDASDPESDLGSDPASDPGSDTAPSSSGSETVVTAAAPIPGSGTDQGQTTSALVEEPRGGQPDGGTGFGTPGGSPGYGGGQASPGSGDDEVSGDGGGDFASPPADGGPAPSGPGSADQPAPHSFDHVPDHAHPYGHGVGPKPGSGPDQAGSASGHAQGPKDKGAKDKGAKDKGAKDKDAKDDKDNGPQGAQDKGAKGSKDKGATGGKDKGGQGKPKDKDPKGKGKTKAKVPGWVKGGPR